MRALSTELRRGLERSVLEGRRAAELGVRAALGSLGVEAREKPSYLSEEQARLRRGLRAKQRQLGGGFELLVWECAYEQWHRLLFARYLAENGLLRHPVYEAPVTLAECEELAEELGEPDGWSVAARFASEILPGIFRLDDPTVQVRLAAEHRLALEQIVAGLPGGVFVADDSLGWVYQYWQSERKDQVNASEVKVGGADLSPVTQLFTENYMVRFLLENSLGAWWAARQPDSPLVTEFEYLRFDEGGRPAAGTFEGWPDTVAEITVMDPCCGSGHFLVEAFGMLWRMRVEEEGLGSLDAQDAVLRDNLFGLELDPRCVQIAMFAVALTAWKQGGGWRSLPTPNIACSGIQAKAPLQEWAELAEGDERLERALERLHRLFKDADTLGSLIDPRRASEMAQATGSQRSFDDVGFDEIAPLLEVATRRETDDPTMAVLGADAAGIVHAASLLAGSYTLVSTNPPYLGSGLQSEVLQTELQRSYQAGDDDLAAAFTLRFLRLLEAGGSFSAVLPQYILYLKSHSGMREALRGGTLNMLARLGAGAFNSIGGTVVQVMLLTASKRTPPTDSCFPWIEANDIAGPAAKADTIRDGGMQQVVQAQEDAEAPFSPLQRPGLRNLSDYGRAWQGFVTGDTNQFVLSFWEVTGDPQVWRRYVTAPDETAPHRGRTSLLRWEDGKGGLVESGKAHNFNPEAVLGRRGVLVAQVGYLACTLYEGEHFNDASCPLIPRRQDDLPAIWAFCSSPEYARDIRMLNQSIVVRPGYLTQVPFDVDRWRAVAEEEYPDGLPEPWSDDPTQWLFEGRPEVATEPLQAGVGRLVGYRWPDQPENDGLDGYADADGIVCLPAVRGEPAAADRLTALLVGAYGDEWSPGMTARLLEEAGSTRKSLADWLRDDFFKHHCRVFGNRPFVWQIWDGRKDGFAALVNYHRLDHAGLEKLTFTYLGDWIERQQAGAADGVAGADLRLAAALELRKKLQAILEGEPPFDIFVRWKSLAEQPIRWDPDLDDGVRLNIRPFVEAGVLRSRVNVHWKKDRGKNPDGSERHNDLHYTNDQKRQARQEAGTA